MPRYQGDSSAEEQDRTGVSKEQGRLNDTANSRAVKAFGAIAFLPPLSYDTSITRNCVQFNAKGCKVFSQPDAACT